MHQPLSGSEINFQSCLEFEKQFDSTKNSLKMVNLPRLTVTFEKTMERFYNGVVQAD